jgi:hypothetical protein
MQARRQLGLLAEQHTEILQRRAVGGQLAAAHGGAALRTVGLGIGQVDIAVAREVRRQRHVQQAALALRRDLGHAGQRLGQSARDAQQPEVAGTLGNEHAAFGQKGHGPGMIESAHHGRDAGRDGCGFGPRLRGHRQRSAQGERQEQRARDRGGT